LLECGAPEAGLLDVDEFIEKQPEEECFTGRNN